MVLYRGGGARYSPKPIAAKYVKGSVWDERRFSGINRDYLGFGPRNQDANGIKVSLISCRREVELKKLQEKASKYEKAGESLLKEMVSMAWCYALLLMMVFSSSPYAEFRRPKKISRNAKRVVGRIGERRQTSAAVRRNQKCRTSEVGGSKSWLTACVQFGPAVRWYHAVPLFWTVLSTLWS